MYVYMPTQINNQTCMLHTEITTTNTQTCTQSTVHIYGNLYSQKF